MPLKDRHGKTITEAWQALCNEFHRVGEALKIYVLDNEKSKDLVGSFIAKKGGLLTNSTTQTL